MPRRAGWSSHEMPWAPGPQSGSVYVIARVLAARGMARKDIVRYLEDVHGHVRQSDRTRAADLAVTWGRRVRAAQKAAAAGNDRVIPRSAMNAGGRSARTGEPILPEAYRYHVEMQFPAGAGGGSEWRTVIIDSRTNMSVAEIHARARGVFSELMADSPRLRNLNVEQVIDSVIVLAERRT